MKTTIAAATILLAASVQAQDWGKILGATEFGAFEREKSCQALDGLHV
ncbi:MULTISPECIES: hypothetical protein [unclassified Pseudomonas]